MDNGWVEIEVLEHINCGAPGTPHLEAAYHLDGHDIIKTVKIRLAKGDNCAAQLD